MDQGLTLITLGVRDLAVSRRFYVETLGWQPMAEPEGVVFFDIGGLILALFPHPDLAKGAGLEVGPGISEPYRGFSLALNKNSGAEIDALFAELSAKNVTILKQPQRAFWGGYQGYFTDPDGHIWEVAHNPQWTIGPHGRITRRSQ
jgi:catechol 2,3-dioxygenase-like lactoylglutathione lyase family enzyme